ncbi:MAG: diaminopimelate decarboxylase [Armatimonadetes bacterium]|nr:diaminopimelate decarboxylase [Armatimonadota bacterium]
MLLGTQKINASNHLEIGGCDAVDLVAEFGTPLYVMDEQLIRENCRAYKSAFESEYGKSAIAYASKAFTLTAMCALAAQEGMWLDVASAGELYTARCAGFPMGHVLFHGNYKSADELEMALECGVKYIVADSFLELDVLSAIAEDAGKTQEILLRCNPGVDPHTHRLISTGQEDSKFGFNIKNGLAMKAVKKALGSKSLKLSGIHCHLGSQLLDFTPFAEAAPVMARFIGQVREETGAGMEILDLGGGPGVRYLESHNPPSIEEFAKVVSEAVICAVAAAGIDKPMLILEPGRSITGEAGTTIYTIGAPKEVSIPEEPGTRTYLPVDGGLSDNPRPALYDALYSAILANRAGDAPTKTYTVSGKHCETDMLIPSVVLPEARVGDLLAVQTTGAYNHSMASNYNRFTRPAVVFVMDGAADIVARRETLEDLIKCDVLPERLRI